MKDETFLKLKMVSNLIINKADSSAIFTRNVSQFENICMFLINENSCPFCYFCTAHFRLCSYIRLFAAYNMSLSCENLSSGVSD